ncbi:hypothetical protein D3C86_1578000 [compost metagenome]
MNQVRLDLPLQAHEGSGEEPCRQLEGDRDPHPANDLSDCARSHGLGIEPIPADPGRVDDYRQNDENRKANIGELVGAQQIPPRPGPIRLGGESRHFTV